jgi:hypothetical protein
VARAGISANSVFLAAVIPMVVTHGVRVAMLFHHSVRVVGESVLAGLFVFLLMLDTLPLDLLPLTA